MRWKPVDATRSITLPKPWPALVADGFSPLLYERVRRFALNEQDQGRLADSGEFLETLGKGYQPAAFQLKRFEDMLGGQISPQQRRHLDAIAELATEFGDMIPSILWNTLASAGIRPNPTQDDSILNIQEQLVHPWYICDAALHAFGISYALFLHVQSHLAKRTGYILFHGCGCTHYLGAMEAVEMNYVLPERRRLQTAKEFLDHLIGQTMLIMHLGYPFVLNPEEAQSVKVLSMRPVEAVA